MRAIRIGIVGTGRFGRLHLQVFRQLAGADVCALADISDEALKKTADEFGISSENCCTDPMALMKRDDLDVIDVVSDEQTHAELVLQALAHGKHVIVEKPLSVTREEAESIASAQRESGKQVYVGHISRFSQPYFAIKKRIGTGMLGDVAAIRAKRNFSRSWFAAFGNRVHPVLESGVHDLDLIVWYAGCRCVRVSAMERNISGYANPDLFSAMLSFENGMIATLDSSWLVPNSGPQNLVETLELDGTIDAAIEVIGTKGTAAYQLSHPGFSIWTDQGIQLPETTLWPTGPDGIGGAIRDELAHFIECARVGKASQFMPLEEAVHVMEIAHAIRQSAASGEVVNIEKRVEER